MKVHRQDHEDHISQGSACFRDACARTCMRVEGVPPDGAINLDPWQWVANFDRFSTTWGCVALYFRVALYFK